MILHTTHQSREGRSNQMNAKGGESPGLNRILAVAIDGPAGAGKSTVARALAERLGYAYISTGEMYRALTLKAIKTGVDIFDEQALADLAHSTEIDIVPSADHGQKVLLDGDDVTLEVRSQEVARLVSHVAKVPEVRRLMAERQRAMALKGPVVMDGRDIGTVVLKDAAFKFFLTATVEERARRRRLELAERGVIVDQKQLEDEIARRDAIDSSRAVAPLRQAPDAMVIDTTHKSVEEVVDELYDAIMKAQASGGALRQ